MAATLRHGRAKKAADLDINGARARRGPYQLCLRGRAAHGRGRINHRCTTLGTRSTRPAASIFSLARNFKQLVVPCTSSYSRYPMRHPLMSIWFTTEYRTAPAELASAHSKKSAHVITPLEETEHGTRPGGRGPGGVPGGVGSKNRGGHLRVYRGESIRIQRVIYPL